MTATHEPAEIERLPAVTHMTDMKFAEQLCLWGVRFWADHYRQGNHPQRIIRDAFRLAGAPEAMADLDGFMSVLVSGLYQPMDVRCMKCAGISEEEFLVMEALALAQRDLPHLAEIALESLLQPAALRIALPMLSSWAANMERAGHEIPFRQWIPEISDPLRSQGRKSHDHHEDPVSAQTLH